MTKVDEFILDLPIWQQEIVEHLRVLILQTAPGVVETLKFKIPYYEYKKHLCYINPKKDNVILGMVHGKILAENNPILVGNQKQVRHVTIHKINEEIDTQLRFLLQEAILLNDELFKVNKNKWWS